MNHCHEYALTNGSSQNMEKGRTKLEKKNIYSVNTFTVSKPKTTKPDMQDFVVKRVQCRL